MFQAMPRKMFLRMFPPSLISGLTLALANIAETTLDNILSFHTLGYSPNELCYKCGKLETCPRSHQEKCF
jgi:primosomal protein N'